MDTGARQNVGMRRLDTVGRRAAIRRHPSLPFPPQLRRRSTGYHPVGQACLPSQCDRNGNHVLDHLLSPLDSGTQLPLFLECLFQRLMTSIITAEPEGKGSWSCANPTCILRPDRRRLRSTKGSYMAYLPNRGRDVLPVDHQRLMCIEQCTRLRMSGLSSL